MIRPHILASMARADVRERVRRYSFLLTLGIALYLAYLVDSGHVTLTVGGYSGIDNSAWLGALTSLVASVFLSLAGFYLVKNTIERDRRTRAGQILAATPMNRLEYVLGKALSNFAVLTLMLGILAAAILPLQLFHGTDRALDPLALLAPMALFALPALAVTAAMAVLFESLPVLRGGIGNILYFFLWTALLSLDLVSHAMPGATATQSGWLDFTGIATLSGLMRTQVQQLVPQAPDNVEFSLGSIHAASHTFLWMGLPWHTSLLLHRGLWLAVAVLLLMAAAVAFDRFDPARAPLPRSRENRRSGKQPVSTALPMSEDGMALPPAADTAWHPSLLTPMASRVLHARFPALVMAELRLMLRGQRWWWYAVAAGFLIACVASPLPAARSVILPLAWIWPVLLWSQLGTREAVFSTERLIFSAPRAFPRQLLAAWAAGALLTLLTGSGLAIRLLIAADFPGLAAWAVAVVFLPSLALALGVFSGTRKTFEAIYTVWWYVGPLHHQRGADFIGTTPASSTPGIYLAFTAILLLAALLWRKARLRSA